MTQNIQKLYQQIRYEESYGSSSAALSHSLTDINLKPVARSKIINIIAILLTLAITLRLTYLNTVSHKFLTDQMNVRVLRTIKLVSMRGTITDRNNQPLAVSTPVDSIWVNPSELENLDSQQLKILSTNLNMSVKEINTKLLFI